MAKKSNNKIELKYTKEDLLWEATRRNELYREEFQNVIDNPKTLLLAKIGNNLNFEKDEDARIRNLILNEKVFPAFSEKWGIEFYNPCESIDYIREKINKGEYAKEQHPYYNWYGKKDLPVIEHEISNKRPIDLLNGIDNYYHFKDFHNVKYGNSETYLFISRNTFKDRVVISFNPDSNLEDIVGKLKKIRNLELKKRKLTLKNENQKMYNIKDINKYINWLKIYDEIKSNIIQLCDGKNLNPVYKSGYLCVPKQISFTEIIPSNFTAERFESATKQYNRAYYGACDLIKNSPYLKFVFPKVPKKKN